MEPTQSNGIVKTPELTNGINYNLNERSDMSQEILSRKTNFLERWALSIFGGILVILFAGTWFIKYPDTINAKAILTATSAPKEIICLQNGRLVKLFVHNNDNVHKNAIIAWIESTGNHEEILEVSNKLDSSIVLSESGLTEKIAALFYPNYAHLGEVQDKYKEFITALQLYNDYTQNGFYERKKGLIENDIRSIENAKHQIEAQKVLTEQDVKLAEESYNMNKTLFDQKVLSKEEFRVEKSKFVNKQLTIPQLESSLLSNDAQKRDKQKELQQLDHDISQAKTNFIQALQSFKSAVDDWKKKYIIISPIDGKIDFTTPLQENQFIQQGKQLGFINPTSTTIYTEAYLPQSNFGKIDTGMQVQLRFDAYPYQEVGYIEGTISHISNVATDSGFLSTIRLNDGLITNNKKPIPYKSRLTAQAIIITKNMRLLERLYYNIVKSTSAGNK